MPNKKSNILITRLEINITPFKKEYISIYSNTDPDQTAYNFSIKHNLPYNIHQEILHKIKTVIMKNDNISTSSNTSFRNNKLKQDHFIQKRNTFRPVSQRSLLDINTQLTIRKLTQSRSAANATKLNLYERGISFQRRTQSKLKELRSKLNESDDEINTFTPTINPISLQAKIYRTKNNKEYNNQTTISHYDRYLSSKLERLKKKHTDPYELENNSFKPNINRSYQTKSNSSSISNRINELYLDYQKRMDNQETLRKNIESSYSFKPSINQNSHLSIPSNKQKKLNKHFHIRLYNYAKVYSDNLTEKCTNTLNSYTNYNVYTTVKSNDIIQQKKMTIARDLFKLLDNDEDGIISRIYVDTRKISKDILKLILPIIKELKNENETLTENEFVNACLHLYQYLNYQEKKLFLSADQYHKKKSQGKKDNENNYNKVTDRQELFKKRRNPLNKKNNEIDIPCNNNIQNKQKSKDINFKYTPITTRIINFSSYDSYVEKLKSNN